jgi:DNA mismatch endonuclease, patch repair protein
MDHLSKEKRSWNMSRIGAKDTKPELIVRSLLHRMGFRFRLNGKVSKKIYSKGVLPGKPDIVLTKYKTVIFVHGCFWHRHEGCKRCSTPTGNKQYWQRKFEYNVAHDKQVQDELSQLGWKSFVIWECEIKANLQKVSEVIKIKLDEQ